MVGVMIYLNDLRSLNDWLIDIYSVLVKSTYKLYNIIKLRMYHIAHYEKVTYLKI